MGTDEKGKMPPSALFLRDLANLRMPFAVRDMQGSSGQMFGTIDVVMALGRGKKDAPTGIPLREPQHLRAPGGSSTNKTSARKGPSVPQAGSSTPFTDLESIAKRPMIELQEQLRTLGMPDSKADREFCWRESRPSSRSRGRYRRLARAPTKHRDVSKLRPTIAVSSSDFAVPTYYLQRKPSTSQKLIVKLNVPSPSPSKPGSHRKSGSFSRPPLEDDEADHDFAPQTPKRQGSGGRRGRGQAWRLGLRRDLSSPSGWVSKTGSSTRIPTPRQPSSPAQDQAPVAGQGSAVADPASGNKPKRRQIRQTGAAPQVQQPSLPPAAVFPTVPASRKPSVPALEPTGPSSHSRKDSGAMATASRSRTLSPEKDSRALTYTSRPITTTGPSTPAPLANPAPPRPSLSKLNTSTSSHLEFKTPAVPASRTQSRVPTPGSTRPSTPASTRPPTPSALIPEVGVPDTSRDCVIAYKPGMVRQIKSERGGTFKEEEVLVGVRFVVCA